MKRTIIAALAAMLIALCLSACGENQPQNDNIPQTIPSAIEPSEPTDPDYDTAVNEPAGVQTESQPADIQNDVQPAGDPMLRTRIYEEGSPLEEFDEVFTVGSDGYEKNLIWCDMDITGVSIYPIEYSEDFSSAHISGDPKFCIDTLKAGSAILYDLDIPEVLPNTAIVYTAGGVKYSFVISYNGRDGGAWFIPMELA